MKKTGIIILIIGLVVIMVTGLSFVTRDKVIDIGDLEISADKKHSFTWSPIIGVVVMAIGVYMVGTKKP